MSTLVIGSGIIGTSTTYIMQNSQNSITSVSKKIDQSDTTTVANGCWIYPDYKPPGFWRILYHIFLGNIKCHTIPSSLSSPKINTSINKTTFQKLCHDGARQIRNICLKKDSPDIIPSKTGFFVDGHKLNQYLKIKAEEKGATFLQDTIVGFESEGIRVTKVNGVNNTYSPDKVIIAAGIGTPRLCQLLNVTLPIFPVLGYSITASLKCKKEGFAVMNKIQTCISTGNFVRMTAKADVGVPKSIITRRLEELKKDIDRVWAGAGCGKTWVGYRPYTPSGRPFIRRLHPYTNVYVNAGHGPIGLTCCLSSGYFLEKIIKD